jgi:hypothetical protein
MIQTLEVGKTFPLPNPSGTHDIMMAMVNGESFDIGFWAAGLKGDEILQWRRGRMHYGVFIKDDIPFFLVDFPVVRLFFDVTIDVLAIKEAGKEYETFLNGPGNMVNLFAIDCRTNILKGMRMIGIEHAIADAIKSAGRQQLIRYPSSAALKVRMDEIMNQYQTEDMIKEARMVQHIAR